MSARPARRRSLGHEIADQLLELIAAERGELCALPPERTLTEQLEVSRTPLREALAALEQAGVVHTRGKTRYGSPARARAQRVARAAGEHVSRELVADPLEARRMLEPQTAAVAAERADAVQLDEVARWLTLMETAVAEGQDPIDYDAGFHVAIARATGNQTLIDLIGALAEALRPHREAGFTSSAQAVELAMAGHRAILQALQTGDAGAARTAMERHLDDIERTITAALADGG